MSGSNAGAASSSKSQRIENNKPGGSEGRAGWLQDRPGSGESRAGRLQGRPGSGEGRAEWRHNPRATVDNTSRAEWLQSRAGWLQDRPGSGESRAGRQRAAQRPGRVAAGSGEGRDWRQLKLRMRQRGPAGRAAARAVQSAGLAEKSRHPHMKRNIRKKNQGKKPPSSPAFPLMILLILSMAHRIHRIFPNHSSINPMKSALSGKLFSKKGRHSIRHFFIPLYNTRRTSPHPRAWSPR